MNKRKRKAPPLILQYVYRVVWSEEDEEFIGLCAEFPSLSWLAETQEAAFKGIVSLVAETVEDMKKEKEPVPMPLSLSKFSGKFIVRTTPELHRTLVIQSLEAGISLNRLVNSRLATAGADTL